MIECLHELATSAGVQRMNISIQATSTKKVSVIIQAILGVALEDLSEEKNALRETLAMPISIEGLAGEVEAKLDSLLSDYVSSIKPHADSLEVQMEKSITKASKANKKDATEEFDAEEKSSDEIKCDSEKENDFSSEETDSL